MPDAGWKSFSMLLLAVKDKEASSSVVLMTSDSQFRKKDIASVAIPQPTTLQKVNNLERKP